MQPEIVEPTEIAGVRIVELGGDRDARGRFVETYRREWFPEAREMLQFSRSDKTAGAVVGLHYHLHQADYWYVTEGRMLVALHDLREGSPTDGGTLVFEIGDEAHRGVYIPPGVGHGFASITDLTLTYLVDAYYNPADELGVAWDDPALAIEWGISAPVLSERDKKNPRRADLPAGRRPYWGLRT